jgi:hypothetical protein
MDGGLTEIMATPSAISNPALSRAIANPADIYVQPFMPDVVRKKGAFHGNPNKRRRKTRVVWHGLRN